MKNYVILRPKKGKKQSLYWPITKIKAVKIKKNIWDNYCLGNRNGLTGWAVKEKIVTIDSFYKNTTRIYNPEYNYYGKRGSDIKINLDHFEAVHTYSVNSVIGSEEIDIFF